MILNKALLLDLDGTLITTNSGRAFPIHSRDWKFIPKTLDAIKSFYQNKYKIIIVSNQGGIEQGYMAEAVFIAKIEDICKKVESRLRLKAGTISYFYCTDMASYNRKPNPGMAYEAAVDYELSLSASVMFGDYKTDEQFANAAGIGTYYDIEQVKQVVWK